MDYVFHYCDLAGALVTYWPVLVLGSSGIHCVRYTIVHYCVLYCALLCAIFAIWRVLGAQLTCHSGSCVPNWCLGGSREPPFWMSFTQNYLLPLFLWFATVYTFTPKKRKQINSPRYSAAQAGGVPDPGIHTLNVFNPKLSLATVPTICNSIHI